MVILMRCFIAAILASAITMRSSFAEERWIESTVQWDNLDSTTICDPLYEDCGFAQDLPYITSVPIEPGTKVSGNHDGWMLIGDMVYEVGSSGVFIEIPAGFVTDYASIPRFMWSKYSPHDQYSRAALIHDYLYWSRLCTRKQADNLFHIAMQESAVSSRTIGTVWFGVRLFGWYSWNANARESKKNMPRVIPLDRTDFEGNVNWEQYRIRLIDDGVTDPPFIGSDYCVFGNSTSIPIAPIPKQIVSPDSKETMKPQLRAFPDEYGDCEPACRGMAADPARKSDGDVPAGG